MRLDRFAEIAADLVNAEVDMIIAGGNPAIRAPQLATGAIPIVGLTDDMVGSGLVRSLSQPGGTCPRCRAFYP